VNLAVAQRILGLLLMLFSLTMLPPAAVSLWYADGSELPFLWSAAIILASGALIWYPARGASRELRVRDGFLIVALFWFGLGGFGALPLALATEPHLSFTDAVTEAVSGFTTTGITVINGLDALLPSINWYRHQLHFLGGMGVVVLAVAILPMLGIGGMQLYKAETPGPGKDSKLTPRITETAKALWYTYLGLNLICALAFWLAGMSAFDALCHAMSTVATGGFSTHDASLGWFNSVLIEWITVAFMVVSAMNFALHFTAWRRLDPTVYRFDDETRYFLRILAFLVLFYAAWLWFAGVYGSFFLALTKGALHVTAVMTTAGFVSADYSAWPSLLPILLMMIACLGGMAGSTSGGIKIVRVMLLYKQGMREVMRLIHPNGEFSVKMNGRAVPDRVMDAVWGFCFAYVALYVLFMLAFIVAGNDAITAFSATSATLNNMGPALGTAAINFAPLNDASKWISTLAMLLGRLELFTILVILTPAFWRS
jgi:trk system potassium uptake protein TrkH